MIRLACALGVAVVATWSVTGYTANLFDEKLSKDKQAVHALNRLTFGPRLGDVERVRRLGVDEWIRSQLEPHRISENPRLADRLQPLESLQLASSQILEKYPPVPNALLLARTPISQVLAADQLQMLLTGTPEQRLSAIASVPAERLPMVLPSLTPAMTAGLPELQKQVLEARRIENEQRQMLVRKLNPPLTSLLSADERRIAQQGSSEERRALFASLDAEKRRQVLRSVLPQAVADLPEFRREALAARQPPQFVNQELIDSRLFRAIYSDRQLEEVLVDFWLNHFNVFNGKGSGRLLLTSFERDAIRPHVLGRFRDLLLATARHPAMLFYLDNWLSQSPREDLRLPASIPRPGLNENYGRELLELHTLGVDGGYTQNDVVAVARAFTGWTIYDLNRYAEFQFNPVIHDRKEKVVLGHTIPAGGGEEDGLRVIEILVRHPSTARFISTKLAQRFVADVPPSALVNRMAATFTRTNGDLRAVVETMLMSREFMSEGAWRAKLKSPLEMVVSAVRAVGAEVTDTWTLSQRIAELGQPLYGKAEPTGYPNTGEAWANTSGFLGRINFASALVAGQIDGVRVSMRAEDAKPGALATRLLGTPPTAATLALLERTAAPIASPATLAAVVLGSPDFQRR